MHRPLRLQDPSKRVFSTHFAWTNGISRDYTRSPLMSLSYLAFSSPAEDMIFKGASIVLLLKSAPFVF